MKIFHYLIVNFLLLFFTINTYAQIIEISNCKIVKMDGRSDKAYLEKWSDQSHRTKFSINFSTRSVKHGGNSSQGQGTIYKIIHYDNQSVTASYKHYDDELQEYIATIKLEMNLITNEIFSSTNFIDGTEYSRIFLCNSDINNKIKKKPKDNSSEKSNSGLKELLKKIY